MPMAESQIRPVFKLSESLLMKTISVMRGTTPAVVAPKNLQNCNPVEPATKLMASLEITAITRAMATAQ